VRIAQAYLIPRQVRLNALRPEEIRFREEALRKIIQDYTREGSADLNGRSAPLPQERGPDRLAGDREIEITRRPCGPISRRNVSSANPAKRSIFRDRHGPFVTAVGGTSCSSRLRGCAARGNCPDRTIGDVCARARRSPIVMCAPKRNSSGRSAEFEKTTCTSMCRPARSQDGPSADHHGHGDRQPV